MAGIGFFAPLPLAMMLPFMAGQSMVMGEAFGKSYQYGKRKISAMSNEEFNALTPQQLGKDLVADYLQLLPSLKEAVGKSSEFQSFVIQELAEIVKNLPADIYQGLTQGQPTTTGFQDIRYDSRQKTIERGEDQALKDSIEDSAYGVTKDYYGAIINDKNKNDAEKIKQEQERLARLARATPYAQQQRKFDEGADATGTPHFPASATKAIASFEAKMKTVEKQMQNNRASTANIKNKKTRDGVDRQYEALKKLWSKYAKDVLAIKNRYL